MEYRYLPKTLHEKLKKMDEDLFDDLYDYVDELQYHQRMPRGWDDLEGALEARPKKTRVTLRVDEDVLKYFRGRGEGYQAVINRVLRTYVTARRAALLKGRETPDPERHEKRINRRSCQG